MIIYLLGMPGSGKSTIGGILASQLGFEFKDMDVEIERETGKSIGKIFEESGENHFRFLEKQLIRMIATGDSIVIATGGGTPVYHDNMEFINETGISVYLKADPGQLLKNLGKDISKRPLLNEGNPKKKISELIKLREPIYLSSRHTVAISGNAEETALEIMRLLKS